MKIRSVGAELFHADSRMDSLTDRRTDSMTHGIVAFAIFLTPPKHHDTSWHKYIHSKSKCRIF